MSGTHIWIGRSPCARSRSRCSRTFTRDGFGFEVSHSRKLAVGHCGPEIRQIILMIGQRVFRGSDNQPIRGTNVVLVRRWVAPVAGKVRLDGEFKLKNATADASAVVVSSAHGVLDTWDHDSDGVRTEAEELAVAAGEALDFFVEPGVGNPGGVEFDWRFTVEAVDSPAMGKMVWNSTGHFDGPPPPPAAPLTVREQFAQVLLMTNEFATLD